MSAITRRLFLRNTAAAGAVVTTIATPPAVEAASAAWRPSVEESALHHWAGLVDALRELTPADCRLTLMGGDMHGIGPSAVRITALRVVQEEVQPGFVIPIERFAGRFRLDRDGWTVEDDGR